MRGFLEKHPVSGGLTLLVLGVAVVFAAQIALGDSADDSWGDWGQVLAQGLGVGMTVGGLIHLVRNYRDGRRTDLGG